MGQTRIDSAAAPGPGDHVLALCHMLANRIGRAFVADLEAEGVTVSEWRVLMTLAAHAPACGQDITERWAMDKMAVNRAVARLKRRGLVRTKQNAADRRVVDVSLTAAGRRLYDRLVPVANARYRMLLSGLEPSEEADLRRILLKMIAHADGMID